MTAHPGTVLAYTIHNGEPWWKHVGAELGFAGFTTVSDLRGEGDYNLVDDFYRGYKRFHRTSEAKKGVFDEATLDDIIARCRLLRWLPRRKAVAMALAMADASDRVLDAVNPVILVCWPIDRYVSDVLARRAEARGIPCVEITASPLLERTMLLHRGKIIEVPFAHAPERIEAARHELADPLFMLPHLRKPRPYDAKRFWKTFGYFRLRGWAFKAISIARRDPLGSHYIDAQAFLGHKPRIGDVRVLKRQNRRWRDTFAAFPRDKRLFMALQLFPEASIDYWIDDLGLVDHENMLVDVARTFSAAGYTICVKDHPLQFGFRQLQLIDRLLEIDNVVFAPYDVTGNEVLDLTDLTLTCTGTLGMQSAMLGKTAITTETYFATPGDFVILRNREEIAELPARAAAHPQGSAEERQRRIAEKLLRGSVEGDYMTFQGFRAHSDPAPLQHLAEHLGTALRALLPQDA